MREALGALDGVVDGAGDAVAGLGRKASHNIVRVAAQDLVPGLLAGLPALPLDLILDLLLDPVSVLRSALGPEKDGDERGAEGGEPREEPAQERPSLAHGVPPSFRFTVWMIVS